MGGHRVERARARRSRALKQVRAAVVVMLAVSAVVAAFAQLAVIVDEPFGFLSKEPAETLGQPHYIGWFAHTVVLVTAIGAGATLFAALAVWRMGGDRAAWGFLLGAGAFTVVLVVDDFLQFHEGVYPRFGVPEDAAFGVYALILAVIFAKWGRHVVRDDLVLGLLAGAWLGVSVLIDARLLSVPFGMNFHVAEDGAKMMGLALWTVFLVRIAVRLVLDRASARPLESAGPPLQRPEPSRAAPR